MTESEKNQEIELGLRQRNLCIGIIGPLASGKSTLTDVLKERWGEVDLIRERPEQNPFLRKFYLNDSRRWSFHSQVWFADDKISQITKPKNNYLSLVDPAFEMDQIYEYTNYLLGNISEDEHNLYLKLCEALCREKKYIKPDIILSTNAPVATLVQYWSKRGRDYEDTIDPDYLKILAENVDQWINNHEKEFLIIRIDSSRWNFVERTLDKNLVAKKIEKVAKGLWYKKYGKIGAENMQNLPFFLKWPVRTEGVDRSPSERGFY